ncbi:MAG: hypothetical protein JWL77_977, partial [Chthonomonadaceae bacterium]|nr:hypothetical protein [Chthonomonadaceae bacterium]
QREALKEMLFATGDKIIAEASPQDAIWGIGMAEDHPNIADTTVWGQNLLGKALMRVRETLRADVQSRVCTQSSKKPATRSLDFLS